MPLPKTTQQISVVVGLMVESKKALAPVGTSRGRWITWLESADMSIFDCSRHASLERLRATFEPIHAYSPLIRQPSMRPFGKVCPIAINLHIVAYIPRDIRRPFRFIADAVYISFLVVTSHYQNSRILLDHYSSDISLI